MGETPHLAILNRPEAIAHAEDFIAPQLDLLRELANYGSNLVVRCFESSGKGLDDILVCGVLLKQIVAMVDAVQVLLSHGCGTAALLPTRAAFESMLYMEWAIKENTRKRAIRYFVANFRKERRWARTAIEGTPEQTQLRATMATVRGSPSDYSPQRIFSDLGISAAKRVQEIDTLLNGSDFREVAAEFTAWQKRSGKDHDPEWYRLDGVTSIRQLAKLLGHSAEYQVLYSKYCEASHTSSYKQHVNFVGQGMAYVPIRQLDEVHALLNHIFSIALSAYKTALEQYRPGELPAFWKQYAESWRESFVNVPHVSYQFGREAKITVRRPSNGGADITNANAG